MFKESALLLSDGSLESAVLCAVARPKHDCALLDVTGDTADAATRHAMSKQIEYLRPRQTHAAPAGPRPDDSDDPAGLTAWTAALAAAAPLVRLHDARAVYLPLRLGLGHAAFARAAEFLQIWEELLRHGLSLGPVRLLAPLLELEPWQVADLSHQTAAPAVASHGESSHAAFVRAGRAKP